YGPSGVCREADSDFTGSGARKFLTGPSGYVRHPPPHLPGAIIHRTLTIRKLWSENLECHCNRKRMRRPPEKAGRRSMVREPRFELGTSRLSAVCSAD